MASTYTTYTLDALGPEARSRAVDYLTTEAYEDADAASYTARAVVDLAADAWALRLGLDARAVADSMTWRTFGPGSGAGPRSATVVDAEALLATLNVDTLPRGGADFVRDIVGLDALSVVTDERTPWCPRVVIDGDTLDAYQVACISGAELRELIARIEVIAALLADQTRHDIEVGELLRIDEDDVVAAAVERIALFCIAGCYLGDALGSLFCGCDESEAAEDAEDAEALAEVVGLMTLTTAEAAARRSPAVVAAPAAAPVAEVAR